MPRKADDIDHRAGRDTAVHALHQRPRRAHPRNHRLPPGVGAEASWVCITPAETLTSFPGCPATVAAENPATPPVQRKAHTNVRPAPPVRLKAARERFLTLVPECQRQRFRALFARWTRISSATDAFSAFFAHGPDDSGGAQNRQPARDAQPGLNVRRASASPPGMDIATAAARLPVTLRTARSIIRGAD